MSNELPYQRLKRLRDEKHISQEKISEVLGVTPKTYRSWEHPNKYGHLIAAGVDDVAALAKLFHVSVDYLLCRTDDRNIGNSEISHALGLSEKSIEFLRYLNNDMFVEKDTILFLNRVLERAWDSGIPSDVPDSHTVFEEMEHYISAKKMNVVCSDPSDVFTPILFQVDRDNNHSSYLDFGNPISLYKEALITSIRKQLDEMM